MATNNDSAARPTEDDPDAAFRGQKPTLPVEEHRRLSNDEISVELCTIDDMPNIALSFYTCFPSFWDKMEPLAQRTDSLEARASRLATRLTPSIYLDKMRWIKAVYVPTGQVAGFAGWAMPGLPVHNVFRHTATAFYGFDEMMGWTEEEKVGMWKGVDVEAWEGRIGSNDRKREEVMRGEEHWFLAPVMVLPEFRGRGVASKLMGWAIEQADRADPVQPMYLESAPTARDMYARFGFEPVGEANFLRRGPGSRGKEKEKAGREGVEKEVGGGTVG